MCQYLRDLHNRSYPISTRTIEQWIKIDTQKSALIVSKLIRYKKRDSFRIMKFPNKSEKKHKLISTFQLHTAKNDTFFLVRFPQRCPQIVFLELFSIAIYVQIASVRLWIIEALLRTIIVAVSVEERHEPIERAHLDDGRFTSSSSTLRRIVIQRMAFAKYATSTQPAWE